jgi:integrase/recombinase XerD
MLIDDVERYVTLRRSLGFKLRKTSAHLASFAKYATSVGDSHVRRDTALEWAAATSSTPDSYYCRLQELALFARFLHAEDAGHEVPQHHLFYRSKSRPAPYIFSKDEVAQLLEAAGNLRRQKPSPLRRHVYVMLFGLIAATGLRVSEALNLKMSDLLPGGVLHIRETKFGKNRLVPLHPSVVEALDAYLYIRARFAGISDHVFLSVGGATLSYTTAHAAFHVILKKAGIGEGRSRRPRIHDLRHSFATHVLEQCGTAREDVARDFVALSTYLGHSDIKHTYWYLEATPNLMMDISAAAEALAAGEVL